MSHKHKKEHLPYLGITSDRPLTILADVESAWIGFP